MEILPGVPLRACELFTVTRASRPCHDEIFTRSQGDNDGDADRSVLILDSAQSYNFGAAGLNGASVGEIAFTLNFRM